MFQRLPRLTASDRILAGLHGVLFSVTLVGAGLGAGANLSTPLLLLAGGALLVGYLYVEFSRSAATHDFLEGSPRLVRFFTRWYQRPGQHTVFCDDLDWMDDVDSAPILRALRDKGSAATVCVRQCSGRPFSELEQAGATMLQIPDSVDTRTKLSINVQDGIAHMIVRVKTDNTDRIRFRQTDNDIFVGVAMDLVKHALAPHTVAPNNTRP